MPSLPRRLAVGRINASVFTSPHATANLDPEAAVIESIQAAKKTFLFAMFSFTSVKIATAISEAAARGVVVTGVVDGGQADATYSQVKTLAAHPGVTINRWDHGGLLHDKAHIADRGTRVGLGSYNWTAAAEKSNVEVLLVSNGRAGNPLATALTDSIMTAFLQGTPIVPK